MAGKLEILVWNQPAFHVADMLALGVNTFVGPEVPDKQHLAPDVLAARSRDWVDTVLKSGANCILRKPWTFVAGALPSNCVGVILSVDEPNGKGIKPADLQAEVDQIRAQYGNVRIFLTLAGDKITDIKPSNADFAQKVQLYRDYAALVKTAIPGLPDGVLIVDWYAKNRNASRYPVTATASAVAFLVDNTGATVYAWWEVNDQQLPKPTSKTDGVNLDVNREPTPPEMQQTVIASLGAGASGGGWFLTCDNSAYGWTPDPVKGDSWYPLINRDGASMRPQYEMMKTINLQYGRPLADPLVGRVTAIEAQVKDMTNIVSKAAAAAAAAADAVSKVNDRLDKLRQV